jgi:IS1 family transposase
MKAKGAGDVWTWTALDPETKLIPCWFVGQRDAGRAYHFIHDLKARLANRVQLTTDGHRAYLTAVEDTFGAEINYAMLQKIYGTTRSTIDQKSEIRGQTSAFPPSLSTSYAERQNLTMRMSMRRLRRLTNGFSKKLENHEHALVFYFMYYNFCRIH